MRFEHPTYAPGFILHNKLGLYRTAKAVTQIFINSRQGKVVYKYKSIAITRILYLPNIFFVSLHRIEMTCFTGWRFFIVKNIKIDFWIFVPLTYTTTY